MPGFDHSVLTDVGWDALTDAEAGQHIEYTHLEAGDGYVYGGDTEIFGMTNLVNKVMDFPITNFTNDGQGQITLIGVISSKNVTTGFNFREIGVRCTVDSGPSILYAVANSGDEADYIPSSAESGVVIQTVQIIIKIDRATNVTVIVQPGLDVTAQNIGPGTVGPGWFRDKSSQILWFKRLNSPKKTIDLIETPDLISIDIPTIDVDLDMWVALGNPDIFPNFSTIQKALDYLTPFSIKAGKTVTIHVSAGTWHGSYVNVKHINSSQINIIGTAGATYGSTSLTPIGDRNVKVTNSVPYSDINVGDYILFQNYNHVSAMSINGCWKVSAMAADKTWLQFPTNYAGSLPNLGGAGVSGTTLMAIKTVLSAASSSPSGFNVSLDLGLLKYVVVTLEENTNLVTAGISCTRGTMNAEWVGAYGITGAAGTGVGRAFLISTTGSMILKNCFASNSYYGFSAYVSGGIMNCQKCAATACWTGGYFIQGTAFVSDSVIAAGSPNGHLISGSAPASLFNTFCYYNGYGITSGDHGNVSVLRVTNSGAAYAGFCQFNSTRDITIIRLASLIRSDAAPFIYGSANIAPNTLSADGCYFTP
jgi:hypothetical protein